MPNGKVPSKLSYTSCELGRVDVIPFSSEKTELFRKDQVTYLESFVAEEEL